MVNQMRAYIYFFIFLVCGLSKHGLQSNPTPTITIEAVNLSQNDEGYFIAYKNRPFQMQIIVQNGGRESSLSDITGLKDIRVVGRTQSSQFSFINGATSANTTYTYEIMPDKTGTIAIGPAIIKRNNETIESNIIHLKVEEAVVEEKKHNTPHEKKSANAASAENEPKVICELSCTKKEVYLGEPFEITLTISSYGNVLQTGIKPPAFSGFWSKEITQAQEEVATRGGVSVGITRKKYILIPQQTGNKKIEPIEIVFAAERPQAQQRKRSGAFADDFFAEFFSGPRIIKEFTSSNELNIAVKEIPTHTNQINGVGSFNAYQASLAKTEVLVNDPVILRLALTGKGNFDQIADLPLKIMPGMKSYKSKTSMKEDLTTGLTDSTKIFEFIIQPSTVGTITIPAQTFSFFDPEVKQFRTISTLPLNLTVQQREADAVKQVSSPSANQSQQPSIIPEETEKKPEIAFIEDEGNPSRRFSFEFPWYIFILLLLLSYACLSNLSWQWLVPERLRSKHNNNKAIQQFKQEFSTANAHKNVSQLYHLFLAIIAHQHNLSVTEVTEEWLRSSLPQAGWQQKDIVEFTEFLHECASLHFMTRQLDSNHVNELLAKAQHWFVIFIR